MKIVIFNLEHSTHFLEAPYPPLPFSFTGREGTSPLARTKGEEVRFFVGLCASVAGNGWKISL